MIVHVQGDSRALHTVLFFCLRWGIDGDAITYLNCKMILCLFFVVLVAVEMVAMLRSYFRDRFRSRFNCKTLRRQYDNSISNV